MNRSHVGSVRPASVGLVIIASLALATLSFVVRSATPAVTLAGVPAECVVAFADSRGNPTIDETVLVPDEIGAIVGTGWAPSTQLDAELYDVKFDEVYQDILTSDEDGGFAFLTPFGPADQGEWILSVYQDDPLCEAHASVLVLPLIDVLDSKFLHNIKWLYVEGITSGCRPDAFCPNGLVTRGQMATFLTRALGLPPASTDYFGDDESSIHEANINALRAAGITAGCTPTTFCPNGLVTRGQMATFLVRAFTLPVTATDYFTDDETNKHESNINRLRAASITTGCGGTSFCPNGLVTRGQMAAFLSRAAD